MLVMAQLTAPSAKKSRRSAPVAKVSPEERVKQFKVDLYMDGGVLFCKDCEHSIDYVRIYI